MRHFFLILLSYLLLVNSLYSQSFLRKELDKIIAFDSDISYDFTPGFIIGIVDGDSTYFESFGNHAGSRERIISKSDIFEIGSVSKTLTSSIIFNLIHQKKLKLDNKVNHFLPLDYQNPRLKNLTISDLLNHTYYFPKRPNGFGNYEDVKQDPYVSYGKKDLLNYYKNYVPENKSTFNYSHVNYALLELVIESIAKSSYEDALLEFLQSGLGMQNSFINLGEKKEGVISPGRDRSLSSVEPWHFPSFAASEGIKSTAEDLVKYISSIFYTQTMNREMLGLNIPTFNSKLAYSNGWHIMKINKNFKAYISTGNTSGHSAFIGMIPETRTGVVILSNSPYGTKDLGILVLRLINYNWKRKA